ncbi:hypothetical protein QTP70_019173 [Hemibagrus guttatus]|uniref:Endonuclease/exonuclease/phosphatase domain-containing protein n=1 Tax=Hemibagrus guttatus TaxID=175788 RepID=A0AAE0RHP9_9TELE|nr:hypothetical protein QTP70_019173 [Hemibagrus guttatus]
MWELWFLLLAGNFIAGNCIAESRNLNINHLDVTYGQQLRITMMGVTEKLEFTSVNTQQSYIIWSRNVQPKKGEVISSGEEKHFVINSVTFDDQGNYTEWNFWANVASVHVVKVLSKRRIQGCMPGKNLSISMDGLLKDDVKLQFFGKDFNLTMVERGLPVGNTQFGYWGRIHITTKTIQVLIVDGSDVGKYILSDRENNTVMTVTLSMSGCELNTTLRKLTHGQEFSIKLPIWFKKLEFSSMKENKSVIWPRCALPTRKYIKGSGYKRQFIIHPVTFNDQGTYTRWNYRDKVSSIYKLEVVYAVRIQDCEAGKTFRISLDGLAKENAMLRFTNGNSNITLVENGSPVGNSHNNFSERIQVTSSDIQVLNIGVSDMGNYTLTDDEGRKVKVVSPHIVWKGRELADMMERRKVDILCVQETRWKGSKARSIGAGFKLFYYGVDSKRNGVGVVLKEEFVRNVLEVKRVSDRVMSLKLEIEGVMLNVLSGYAPQVGCELEEKERFWSELDEVMESIPTGERVVIGADFNGHVGEGNTGDEEVMGKFGVKERNLEGQMVVDFAKRMDMAVVNTYFQKREEHRLTYKSGGRSTQVDYILCRRGNLKEISDCKVVVGESVARQHRMVVCRMTLLVCKMKRSKIEKKTKWWKLKKEECCVEFREKLRQALGGQVVLPDDWETTAEVIRETGRKVLGVSSGRRKEDKETWWWNEEVQDSIQRKRLAKKKWDMDRTEENRQEYKELQLRVKREVSKAKQKAYDKLYTRLDTREGEKDLYRLARQRDRDGKDVQQVRVIKDRDGRVLTSEESVQRRWKEYFEELMNEENERGKKE